MVTVLSSPAPLASHQFPDAHPNRHLQITQDVKCFHCGFVSGQFVSQPELAQKPQFRPTVSPTQASPSLGPGPRIRCVRCGGPVFLDEIETVIMLREDDWKERPKRGRKAKRLLERTLGLSAASV